MSRSDALPYSPLSMLREAVLLVCAALAYFAVRGLGGGNPDVALHNAQHVVDLERLLGFFWEPALQNRIIGSRWLVDVLNVIYIWGHLPLIAAAAVWLMRRQPTTYRLVRNAFLISGAVGLVIYATFPVAPPRLAGLGIVDTVTLHSNAYRVLQPPAFTNQYAAVPSLHFGWNLLIGIALFRSSRHLIVRCFACLMPVAMLLAIILTANHYIFDAVTGAMLALFGLFVAAHLPSIEQYTPGPLRRGVHGVGQL